MDRKPGALYPVIALALVVSTAAARQPADPDAAELEPITVTAPVAPLDRSLYLLRLLVAQSAPCLGCDAVLADRRTPAARLLSYLLESEPPEPTEADLLMFEIKVKDSPDLEYLRP
jgi:hypothetical protein